MVEEIFIGAFANTLSKEASNAAFNEFVTHHIRNVLRLYGWGRVVGC